MSQIPVRTADPSDKLPYQIDWRDFLGSETLASAVWTLAEGPDELFLYDDDTTNEGVATVWGTGGTPDARYRLRCQLTRSDGAIKNRSIWVEVRIE